MIRILTHDPLLAIRDDLASTDYHSANSLNALIAVPSTQHTDLLEQFAHLSDTLLRLRLVTCLVITQPTLVILTAGSADPAHLPVADGQVIVLATRAPAFAHIARSRPLPAHEQQRRLQILAHPHFATCVEVSQHTSLLHVTHIAQQLGLSSAATTAILKQFGPIFVPTTDRKSFRYDSVAHHAITLYDDEAALIDAPLDPRQQLPDVVKRYANHHGKINQLPVRAQERAIVLQYLAQQLPTTPMSEPQINAAILQHVAFDDYATARRDMVDLGLVTRTASGSLYQRINDAPADRPTSAQAT